MRRTLLTAFAVLAALIQLSAQEQTVELYFEEKDLPDGVSWLPAPPDTIGALFAHDIMQYMWGKSIRDTERGRQAVAHVVTSAAEMAEFFSVPFGMTISEEATPAIFKLVSRSIPTFRLAVAKPKETYRRLRPYVRFGEQTAIPWDEESERNTGSYPSGHTIRGWGLALVLSELNPERQDSLLKLGYEWGQSRVIAGYHWQSDVDASRLMAAGVFARLHTSPAFLADMAAAREELQRLKGETDGVRAPAATPSTVPAARIYRLDGTPATEQTRGIVISRPASGSAVKQVVGH